jgi:transposase-like protein
MPKKSHRRFSAEQKSAILKRHLIDKVAVSDLCDEYKIQPSVFYGWQARLFENAQKLFELEGKGPSREKELNQRVEMLEQKLAKKDGVIAEISAEYVQLKKELGEL